MTYSSLKGDDGSRSDFSASATVAEKLKAVGERLKTIRGKRGQAEFSAHLGTTPQSLRRYEHGDRALDYPILLTLVETFGVDPRWLFTGAGDPYGRTETSTSTYDDTDMSLLLDCFTAVGLILKDAGQDATHEQRKVLALKMFHRQKSGDTAVSPSAIARADRSDLDSIQNPA